MRIGLSLPAGDELRTAEAAEAAGLFAVLVGGSPPGVEMVLAAEVAAHTDTVRLVVRVPLGSEHPVTLAEELAVLDAISGGRLVVLADTGELDTAAAAEDLDLLRRCWVARPVQHAGPRWRVPRGLPGHDAPAAVMVTPCPSQIDVPVWLTGRSAGPLAPNRSLPVLAGHPAECNGFVRVQPAITDLAGDPEEDRDTAVRWADAGATHLLVRVPPEADLAALARYVVPEVAMPHFPRVIAESPAPARWPVP